LSGPCVPEDNSDFSNTAAYKIKTGHPHELPDTRRCGVPPTLLDNKLRVVLGANESVVTEVPISIAFYSRPYWKKAKRICDEIV
jgi:hypothetical protein